MSKALGGNNYRLPNVYTEHLPATDYLFITCYLLRAAHRWVSKGVADSCAGYAGQGLRLAVQAAMSSRVVEQ